eukprot:CAMPEP_0181077324 /NCGR_PEP_ID=MMETSP1071-20121207/891_1 /TAXON_ID=35127 /ORGANISM="Thalassiosira sp., Strain NH16" /LENGTH=643 /DNA_ID=CAMNT_0023158563 /DNA_START=134 /DNA_END=2065 /DNA_ORIENTATION=-
MSRPSALRETLKLQPCHSLEVLSVLASGDCFYDCIHELLIRHDIQSEPLSGTKKLPPLLRNVYVDQSSPNCSESANNDGGDRSIILSSQSMRDYVADQLTSKQLDLYKMYAVAGLDEYKFSTDLTLEDLKSYARKSGRKNGPGNCFWADEFALRTTSDGFHLTLLIIDDQATRGGGGGSGVGSRKRRRSELSSNDNRFIFIGSYPRVMILHRSRREHYNAVVIDNRPVMDFAQLPVNVRSLWSVETSEHFEDKPGDPLKSDLSVGNLVLENLENECILDDERSQKPCDKEHLCSDPSHVSKGGESLMANNHSTKSSLAQSALPSLGNFYCGCAGFSSSSWVGNFYPKTIVGHNSDRQLDHYQQHFRTVEINSTFYGIPSESTLKKWKKTFAKTFKVVVKAPRGLTHEQPYLDCSVLAIFLSRMRILDGILACILIQCPRTLSVTISQLAEIKVMLQNEASWYKGCVAFEFRNEATYRDKPVQELLKENNFALVVHPNSLGRSTIGSSTHGRGKMDLQQYQPEQLSEVAAAKNLLSNFVYLRLHGFNDEHSGEYSIDQLKEISQQIHFWREQGLEVYCFFLNDLGPTVPHPSQQKPAAPSWNKWCAMPKNAKQLECLVYGLSNEDIPDAPKKPKSTLLNFFGKK